MTELVATPDVEAGAITVMITDIPDGYEDITVYRELDGMETVLVTDQVAGTSFDVVDNTVPPGWTLSYRAVLSSPRGINLATNPGFEDGTLTDWVPSGSSATTRDDGTAHGGSYYARLTANSLGLVHPNVSSLQVVTASSWTPATANTSIGMINDADASYARNSALGNFLAGTQAPVLTLEYATFLTVAAGQQVTFRAIVRGNRLSSPTPLSTRVRLRVRFYDSADALLATEHMAALSGASFPETWVTMTGTTAAAPANTAKVKCAVVADGDYVEGEYLDVAYFGPYLGTTAGFAAGRIYQQVPVTPDQEYKAEAWVKAPASLPAMPQASVNLAWLDSGGAATGTGTNGPLVTLGSGWMLAESATVAAPPTAATMRVSVQGSRDGSYNLPNVGNAMDADDLYITDLQPATLEVGPESTSLPARFPGDAYLKDAADPARALRTMVNSLPTLTRAGRTHLHEVEGRARPVPVSDVRMSETGDLRLITRGAAERETLLDLLADGKVLLFQTTPEALLPVEMYIAIEDAVEERIGPLVTEQWRYHQLSFTVVDAPVVAEPMPPYTYRELAEHGISYQNVLDNRATYLAVYEVPFT